MARSILICSHPTGSMQDVINILQQYPILETFIKHLSQSELLNLMLTCKTIHSILNPTAHAQCITNLRKKAIQYPAKVECPRCHFRMTRCTSCPRLFHVSIVSSSISFSHFFGHRCPSSTFQISTKIKISPSLHKD